MTDNQKKSKACSLEGCDSKHHAKELCQKHYRRSYRNGKKQCSVDECMADVMARGLCSKHYLRKRRTGSTDSIYEMEHGTTCKIFGCENPHYSRKVCQKHYKMARVGEKLESLHLIT